MKTRPPVLRTLALVLVAGSLLLGAAGCGDDDSEETQTDAPSSTEDGGGSGDSGGSSTTAPPDGGGGGDAGASLPDRPAELVGEVTEAEGERFLVEEDPASPDSGRKAWVAIEGPVLLGDEPADAAAIEVGQRVQVWTGICAESYPEQCGAEAFVIDEG
jgi:hypothetical protein